MDTSKSHELFDWSHDRCDATEQIDLCDIITCYQADVADVNRERYNRLSTELIGVRSFHFIDRRNVKFRRGKICVRQAITERILQI